MSRTRRVTLQVDISLEIPRDLEFDDLCLGMAEEEFRVIRCHGAPVDGVKVLGYTTQDVLDDSWDDEEEVDEEDGAAAGAAEGS